MKYRVIKQCVSIRRQVFVQKEKFILKMKIDRPNTLIVFCQNRGYKKLPKNIPVENLGRDIKKPQNNGVTYTHLDCNLDD